ncbi:MAG TPA: NUDIX hydrolase [Ktedonobacterales bacterium]|nr:NUDIX hydrolase [Ktedonobacterales bacterium]
MITFKIDQSRFMYRVAGICLHEDHVLLQAAEDSSFWFLPGGRVEMLESSEAALKREMREELRLENDVQVLRLLWVVENFFRLEETAFHEIGFYYQIALADHSELYDKTRAHTAIEDTGAFAAEPLAFTLRWFPLDALDNTPLYPAFLRAGLRSLPASVQHIVHIDSDE